MYCEGYLKGQMPEIPIFGSWIGVFKLGMQNIDFQNYSSDSNQILYNDKDQQVLIVSCSKMHPFSPRCIPILS